MHIFGTPCVCNPLDYHVWDAMLEKYKAYTPKTTMQQGGTEDSAGGDLEGHAASRARLALLCWHSGRGYRRAYRQKDATLCTFSSRDQHRKRAHFRANSQFKKKSHSLHCGHIVPWLNRFFRFFVEMQQLFYLSIFFDQIWWLDVKLSPLQTLKILA